MNKRIQVIVGFVLALLSLTSCSRIGLLSDDNSWLPFEINTVGEFFMVYIVLQISIFLISLLLGLLFGKVGYAISLLLHLIWIVVFRDYGFFKVLLLFVLFSILLNVFNKIKIFNRK